MNDNFAKKLVVKQQGFAFLMLVFVLSISIMAVFISHLGRINLNLERDIKTTFALNNAKIALIGYMLKRQSPERVGDLPCPDKSSDKNYDGTQDAPCTSSRMGKFPWRNVDDQGRFVDGISLDLRDGYGERLWLVVSRNLVDPANVTIDDTIMENPPYPWVSVFDAKGMLISNRAAALIISPGEVIGSQNRRESSLALPTAAQFLDAVTVNDVKYTNSSATSTKFISGKVYDQSGNLLANDQIIFLTIDEVMPLIKKVNNK